MVRVSLRSSFVWQVASSELRKPGLSWSQLYVSSEGYPGLRGGCVCVCGKSLRRVFPAFKIVLFLLKSTSKVLPKQLTSLVNFYRVQIWGETKAKPNIKPRAPHCNGDHISSS